MGNTARAENENALSVAGFLDAAGVGVGVGFGRLVCRLGHSFVDGSHGEYR